MLFFITYYAMLQCLIASPIHVIVYAHLVLDQNEYFAF